MIADCQSLIAPPTEQEPMACQNAAQQGVTSIVDGQIIALFAFDIGYEIILDKLAALSPATPVQPLSQRKKTPSFLQYSRPPFIVPLGFGEVIDGKAALVRATIFDFGSVSLSYSWPLASGQNTVAIENLPEISQTIFNRDLRPDATRIIKELMSAIGPAIVRPALSTIVEDYYLFVVEKMEPQLKSTDLLGKYRSTLAGALRFESASLSDQQQREALTHCLSYYESDLLLIDWNAAFIYDRDYEDTARVLELLNVELLEARYIDSELDRRIQESARLTQRRRQWPIPLRNPFKNSIRDLTELRVEYAVLNERVGNALKLVGDLYLARVHSAGAERFYLQEWENTISHKLEIVDRFYELVTDRLRTAQSQALELAIFALILVEILLAIASLK